ncbi:YfhO family protein [Anaeromyxobacter paludicola]|uniref:YfhO family protein n=1 Tax=Anaeromyxobacter paludicola TaxID=2918171 RepID=A0ABM7X6J9_9BACT|nr:YfhO family protein [Anaeromyxobacter paludicola]BDG07418.1 hypothetical protein AMPC_05310 [Anaeromyxobacter paludicola]
MTPRGCPSGLARVALALAALLGLAWAPVLLGGAWVQRDALRYMLPAWQVASRALAAGRWPEWMDGVGFGAAFAANPVHAVATPLGWLAAALPGPGGLAAWSVLHLLVAGLGAAAFAARLGAARLGALFAGASLALGGYAGSVLVNGLGPAIAWTPWVAWAAEGLAAAAGQEGPHRRRALAAASAWLAAALAFQLSTGEPLCALGAAYLAGVVLLARSPRRLEALGALAASGAAALLLAAVAVLPAAALLAGSSRLSERGAQAGSWALHPLRLVELVWPGALGDPAGQGWLARALAPAPGGGEPFWSLLLHAGAPALLLAAWAGRERRLRGLLAGSGLLLLLALGAHTPVWPAWRAVFLPEQLGRYAEKHVFGALVLWSALAGVGFTRCFEERRAGRGLRAGAWAAAAGLAAAALGLGALRPVAAGWVAARAQALALPLDAAGGVEAAVRGGLAGAAGAAAFAVALGLAARARLGGLAAGLAAAGALLPSVGLVRSAVLVAPRALVESRPAALAPIPASPGRPPPRLMRPEGFAMRTRVEDGADFARLFREALEPNVPASFGVAALPGFEPSESRRALRFWATVFPRMTWESLTRLCGVEWVYVQRPMSEATGLPAIAAGPDGWSLQRAPGVRPRAFVTPRWARAATEDEALSLLAADGREADPALVVLAGPGPLPPGGAEGPLVPCEAASPEPERVEVRCEAPRGGQLVLLDELADGWTAELDGRPAPIALADGLFRAVQVEPGRHRAVFRYRTPGLRLGAAISLAAWAAWGLALTRLRRRGRAAPG